MQNMIFVLYPLFCILLPCMLYVLIQTKGFHRRTNFIHMIWVFIFLYYVYLVLETTGIGTIWEIGLYPGMKLQEEINLIPFRDGISLSMILNVVMFMPLGFLLPLLWKEYQSLVRTAIIGFCFSCGIEFCQLFNRRVSDVDDLLMNTLGAIPRMADLDCFFPYHAFKVWTEKSRFWRERGGSIFGSVPCRSVLSV